MPSPQWFQGEIGFVLERLLKERVAERKGWIDSERELDEHRNGHRDKPHAALVDSMSELWFRVVVTGELGLPR